MNAIVLLRKFHGAQTGYICEQTMHHYRTVLIR